MSTMEQALRDALADLLTEAGYMAQQLAHRGLPGVPGDSVDRAIASAKAALTAALPAPGVEEEADDETCTDCWGTGWNGGLERVCDCQPIEAHNQHVPGVEADDPILEGLDAHQWRLEYLRRHHDVQLWMERALNAEAAARSAPSAAAPSAPAEISQAQAQAMREALKEAREFVWFYAEHKKHEDEAGAAALLPRLDAALTPEPPR